MAVNSWKAMFIDKNITYLGSYYPHHAKADMSEISDCGFTSITFCINELDWWRYRDMPKYTVKAAHDLDLKVFVDMHGFGQFAGPYSYYLAEHPECCQIDNRGDVAWNRACPNNPTYVTWLTMTAKEIIRQVEPDGMFWDEPHFASSDEWPRFGAAHANTAKPHMRNSSMQRFRRRSHLRFQNFARGRHMASSIDSFKLPTMSTQRSTISSASCPT